MTYIFNDPIHGTIELERALVHIIDTPEFQRLRNIKQTGIASYVYPGATHSRFEHCIGVCYLAGQTIDRLSSQTDIITPVDKLCVQIAGLIHDLGHGPFSHLFGDSFIRIPSWSHELQSCRVFDHILERHEKVRNALADAGLLPRDIVFIKELVNSEDFKRTEVSDWPFTGREREKSFLYEIVANGRTGIDVDKFDYLQRDCYFFGVNCTFDWRRLVNRMKLVEYEGEQRIAIRDKERDNLFNMFYLRMHLRRIAYSHPTVVAIAHMVADVLKLADESLLPECRLSESPNHMEVYLSLTDAVLETIANSRNTTDPNIAQAKALIERIHTRRLYTLLCSTPPSNRTFPAKETILTEVFGENSDLSQHLAIKELRLNFGKWGRNGDPLQPVVFYDKHGTVTSERLYHECSMFVPLSWSQRQLLFFCKSEDSAVQEQLKGKVNDWITNAKFTPSPRSSQ